MLILSGVKDVENDSGEYGSWLTDRLGNTGAGVAIGAAALGAGFAANKYMNLGLGDKSRNLINRITGSTTAGQIATGLAPAAASMAVAAATGGGGPSPEQAAAQQAQAEQAYIQQAQAEQAAARSAPKAEISPWIPLGIIATAAAGWFAFKD